MGLLMGSGSEDSPTHELVRDDLQDTANKSTVDSTWDSSTVKLIPGRNGGMVQIGWPKGKPKPQAPSPTALLREQMRQGLAKVLPNLIDQIASGKISTLQGADFLAKYGIGATGTVTIVSPDVIGRLERQATLIASRSEWLTVDLLAELRDIWT
jgi:hypothetical protein